MVWSLRPRTPTPGQTWRQGGLPGSTGSNLTGAISNSAIPADSFASRYAIHSAGCEHRSLSLIRSSMDRAPKGSDILDL
jgi:hypothetical protein